MHKLDRVLVILFSVLLLGAISVLAENIVVGEDGIISKYFSSDGSPGLTQNFTTESSIVVVKDGLVVEIVNASNQTVEESLTISTSSLVDDLVAYYKLDEISGTTVYDSKELNDGLNNGSSFTVGRVDGAYSFDGISDYAEISGISGFATSDDHSVFWWMNITSSSQDGAEVIEFSDGSNCNGNPGTYIRSGSFELNRCGASASYLNFGTLNNLAGDWHLFGYNYSGGYVTMWVDGEIVVSNGAIGTWATVNNPYFHIASARTHTQNFNAVYDEIGIWSRALNSTEIEELWNNGEGLAYE